MTSTRRIYEEETGGAGTYSGGADTLLYSGEARDVVEGLAGQRGSFATSVQDQDNIMFHDTDKDGEYDPDLPEPLLDTPNFDLRPGDPLVPEIEVLARHRGNWPLLSGMDLYRFSDFALTHADRYTDANGNHLYDDGVAILKVVPGRGEILELNLRVEIPGYAPTGFYDLSIVIRPVGS